MKTKYKERRKCLNNIQENIFKFDRYKIKSLFDI